MASLSPPATTNISSLQPSPLFHKASQVSLVGKQNPRFARRVVSCNAINGDQRSTSSSKNGESPLGKLGRRNVLLGLGGLYGVSSLCAADPFANRLKHKSGVANAAEIPNSSTVNFPIKLDSTFRVDVPRPKKSRSKQEKDDEEEVLVVKGIELERDKFVKFDVFINDEDDPVSRPDNTEFAGSFVNVPHKHSRGKKKSTTLRLGITELLEDLDAEDDDSVVVTLVPRYGCDAVTIGGIAIEFSS